MFSLGWMEISIILIITIIIVGPKEIPTVIKFIKSITSNLRKLSKEFNSTVDEITHIQEVKDIKKEILDTKEAVLKEGKELDEFIDTMNADQMKLVMEFFNSMPKLRHPIKFINPKTKVKNEVMLEGLASFLE